MTMLEGIFLGCIEGLTEFLPVSSFGHLVLVHEFFTFDETNIAALIGVLYLSTAGAAILYFRSDIWMVLQALLRKMGRLPVNEKDLTLLKALLLGTIPAITVGLFFEPLTLASVEKKGLVAGVLLFSSVFLMYAEWRYYNRPVHESVTAKNGFLIGLFQVLALLPGFSRSGATIAGGMLLGMSRYEAAKFSFLLAIPITLVVGVRKLLSVITSTGSIDWTPVIAGGMAAFVLSLICIHSFLVYSRKYTLWPFIWYGVVLAALVGYVSFIS